MSEYTRTLLPIRWPDGPPKRSYDVVIIGGGGHGLSTAYHLATRHGITNVAVIEADYIASGNTGRNTTIIRANYGIPESIRFYQHSLEKYQELEAETGAAILHQTKGIIWLAHTEMAMRTERARAAMNQAVGAETYMRTPAELKALIPQLDLTGGGRYPVLGGSHHVQGATARHDRVAWAYASIASQRGVDIFQHTAVTAIRRDGDGGRVIGVDTTAGPIDAGAVLSAVGGRITQVAAMAGLRLPIRTHPLHAFVTNDYAQGFPVILASDRAGLLRVPDGPRPDAHRRRVRQPAVVLAAVVVQRAALVQLQDHPPAAVPARHAHPAHVGRHLRHLGRLLADHERDRHRWLLRHDGLGDVGLQGHPGRRRGHGRADRHGPAAGAHRAVLARSLPARPRAGRCRLGGDALMGGR